MHHPNRLLKVVVLGGEDDQIGNRCRFRGAKREFRSLPIEEDAILLVAFFPRFIDKKADLLLPQQLVQSQSVQGSDSPTSDQGDGFHSVASSMVRKYSFSSCSILIYSSLVWASS
ncbi:hypothetical protein SDC9_85988 [bioreactor metagenome]|uniref:Uncharacterized protein n=1 Tax=bioreactor metagenome TaxID=1076179 RepID=A0A644ZEN7_9ZZZZ